MVSVGRIGESRGEGAAAVIVVMMGMVGMGTALCWGEQWVVSHVLSAVFSVWYILYVFVRCFDCFMCLYLQFMKVLF